MNIIVFTSHFYPSPKDSGFIIRDFSCHPFLMATLALEKISTLNTLYPPCGLLWSSGLIRVPLASSPNERHILKFGAYKCLIYKNCYSHANSCHIVPELFLVFSTCYSFIWVCSQNESRQWWTICLTQWFHLPQLWRLPLYLYMASLHCLPFPEICVPAVGELIQWPV